MCGFYTCGNDVFRFGAMIGAQRCSKGTVCSGRHEDLQFRWRLPYVVDTSLELHRLSAQISFLAAQAQAHPCMMSLSSPYLSHRLPPPLPPRLTIVHISAVKTGSTDMLGMGPMRWLSVLSCVQSSSSESSPPSPMSNCSGPQIERVRECACNDQCNAITGKQVEHSRTSPAF